MTRQAAQTAIDPLLTASMELGRDGLAVPPAFLPFSRQSSVTREAA
jgi:hypothetical protein